MGFHTLNPTPKDHNHHISHSPKEKKLPNIKKENPNEIKIHTQSSIGFMIVFLANISCTSVVKHFLLTEKVVAELWRS